MSEKAYQFVIPQSSEVHKKLLNCIDSSDIIILSGLPGVGKSLYIKELYHLAKYTGRDVDLIQWDQARKSFETPQIFESFPIVDGQVHNAVKLMVGEWLMDVVRSWIEINKEQNNLLLIEAPLVGHRFLELVLKSDDESLENFLSSEKTKVLMPIPSINLRKHIEDMRAAQVKEDAKVWFGAKPSVVKILWQMTCEIALEMGYDVEIGDDPEYDPEIYSFVFSRVLKHRHFIPIIVDEKFDVSNQDEASLHSLESLKASDEQAETYARTIRKKYPDDKLIDELVQEWYKT